MSIVATALRIATVKALTQATLAGARVFDSAIDPLSVALTGDPQPVIVVYTEDEAGTGEGGELNSGDRTLDLVLHFLVAGRVTVQGQDTDAQAVSIEIPEAESGLEVMIDLLRRQTERVLQTGASPWADLWRMLISGKHKRWLKRGASSEKGQRYAAREYTLQVGIVAEPAFAGDPDPFWIDMLELFAADADPEIVKVGQLLAREIHNEPNTDSQVVAAFLGLPHGWIEGIGFAPLLPTPAPDIHAAQVTIEDQRRGTEITLVDGTLQPFDDQVPE